jgi:hypothetical protein
MSAGGGIVWAANAQGAPIKATQRAEAVSQFDFIEPWGVA